MKLFYNAGPGEIIDFDEDCQPLFDFKKEEFATTSDNSLSFYHGSESILFSLTSLEYKVLYFSMITMDQNFLIPKNQKWINSFQTYMAHYGINGSFNSRSLSKYLSELTKKKALIRLNYGPKGYMVNPLFFSKRGNDRKKACEFLLNIQSLPWPEASKGMKELWKTRFKKNVSGVSFNLSAFYYNLEKQRKSLEKFEKDFNIPRPSKNKNKIHPLYRDEF